MLLNYSVLDRISCRRNAFVCNLSKWNVWLVSLGGSKKGILENVLDSLFSVRAGRLSNYCKSKQTFLMLQAQRCG